MLRRLAAVLIAATTVSGAALAVPAIASAARWSAADPAGDVVGDTRSEDPPPCGTSTDADPTGVPNVDITRLVVRHSRDAVTFVVHLDELTDGDVDLVLPVLVPGHDYAALIERRDGRLHREVAEGYESSIEAGAEHPDECGGFYIAYGGGPCHGMKVSFSRAADAITAVVPRACLGDPRWVRAGAETTASRGDTFYADAWGHHGSRPTYRAVYGPKVAAAPRHAAHR